MGRVTLNLRTSLAATSYFITYLRSRMWPLPWTAMKQNQVTNGIRNSRSIEDRHGQPMIKTSGGQGGVVRRQGLQGSLGPFRASPRDRLGFAKDLHVGEPTLDRTASLAVECFALRCLSRFRSLTLASSASLRHCVIARRQDPHDPQERPRSEARSRVTCVTCVTARRQNPHHAKKPCSRR